MDCAHLILLSGVGLAVIGVFGILTRENIIRIALGFTLASTGMNLLLVWSGFLPGRTAPIIDDSLGAPPLEAVVDPLPQALVLTSIVIAVAVSALFVVVAVLTSRKLGTAHVRRFRSLKW